jgi:hypothetical protein
MTTIDATGGAGQVIDLMVALKESLTLTNVRQRLSNVDLLVTDQTRADIDWLLARVEGTARDDSANAAREALRAIVTAGERMAQAHAAVQDLADGRAAEKSFAIRRLMSTTNEETGKPHSATSAEKVVEHDEEYRAYRRAERDAEVERLRSLAAFETAKRSADLELELHRAWERNQ